jgi:hypothetical protein
MSSDGIVKKQDGQTYFNEFVDLSKKIIDELDLIIPGIKDSQISVELK